jgi:TolA-binding protein
MHTFTETRRPVTFLLVAFLAATSTFHVHAQDDAARRRLETARGFMRDRNYAEALNDFQKVLELYPTSPVADDALLDIATYQLEVAGDAKGAEASVDRLLKSYAESDSAPMGQVLKGRVALAAGVTPDQVKTAIASFDRVSSLYPGTTAVPAAIYYSGEAARLGGRRDDAIDRFRRVMTQYPGSPWTMRALMGSAWALVAAGQPTRAMDQLQRVRQQFPSTREAATALDWNTILYRLYIRAPSQPAYLVGPTIGGQAGKFKDVSDIGIDRDNNLVVAAKSAVTVVGAKSVTARTITTQEPRALFFNAAGRVMTIHDEGTVSEEGKPGIVLSTTSSDGKLKPLKLEAGIAMSTGDLIVADRDLKALLRYSAEGKPKPEFARQIVVHRLAVSELDEVAALDMDTKTVSVFARDGKPVTRIPERGTNYQLRKPSDVGFDRLGHVYVLDRGAILVFSTQGPRLITSFTTPEKGPGAIGSSDSFALDSAARLYVFDERTNMVQVFR